MKPLYLSTLTSRITILSLTFVVLSLSFNGIAQMIDQECGTEIDVTNLERLKKYNERWLNRTSTPEELKAYGGSTYFVPVQLHLIRQNSGLGGISEADALAALDRMNEYYIDASIHFYQCSPINNISNSTYYDYNKNQMNDLDAAYSQANVVNIYVANSATSSSGSAICGHAQFPGGLDFIIQSTSCMNNGSTLAHEMGHYLGLYHTHSTTFGDEAVDGSDCATQGDLLCDTPADPRLSGGNNFNNDGCIYFGTDTDENGDVYLPNVSNLLSYASKECRFTLTEGQLDKALWTLQNERSYLSCAPPAMEANFYVRHEESCNNSKLFSFYNVSQGVIGSYSWDFGDGVGTSTAESPDYIYWEDGIYTVTLTVSNGGSTQTYSQKVAVGPISIPYTNDFEAGADDLDDFITYGSMKNEVVVHPDAAESGAFGLLLDGTEQSSTSPSFQTPNTSEAFQELWNPYYKARAELCVDASYHTDLQLEFDKRQIRTSNDNYTQFVITVNGQEEGPVVQVNSSGNDDPNFTHLVYDLSAYNNQIITIGFEGTHKYDKDYNGNNDGTATFIDNISITGVLSAYSPGPSTPTTLVYPNPAEDLISIKFNQDYTGEYAITDLLGKDVSQLTSVESNTTNRMSLDISKLSPGAYYIITRVGAFRFIKK